MRTKRTYSVAFKRQVVEELISGSATMGQLSRRYEISTGLIGHWKSRYGEGKLVEGKAENVKALEAKVKDLEQMVGRLTMDNELLKKPWNTHCGGEERIPCRLQGRVWRGQEGCEMLKMARSAYYYRKRLDLQKQKEDADIRDRIEKIIVEHERYGYRRVTAQLHREGLNVNHKRVQRIMREEELICKVKKKWVAATDSSHPYPVAPNLLKGAKIT